MEKLKLFNAERITILQSVTEAVFIRQNRPPFSGVCLDYSINIDVNFLFNASALVNFGEIYYTFKVPLC